MKLFTSVNQINLRVKDTEKLKKWYQDVLGLYIWHDYGTTVVLGFTEDVQEQSTAICLIELSEEEEIPQNVEKGTYPVIAISEEQAEVCRESLINIGVKVVEGGSKAHFKFEDPDGNLLEAYLPGLYTNSSFAHLR